jgi:hypothetical protein
MNTASSEGADPSSILGLPATSSCHFLLLTGLEKNGRVVIEFSNDAQAPYRLFPDASRGNAARTGYVHVTGAII